MLIQAPVAGDTHDNPTPKPTNTPMVQTVPLQSPFLMPKRSTLCPRQRLVRQTDSVLLGRFRLHYRTLHLQ